MAYADFDFLTNIAAPHLQGAAEGLPRLHASIPSPLTGAGEYCREFSSSATGNVLAMPKVTVDGGAWDQLPSTKQVSTSAYVYKPTSKLAGTKIGVAIKCGLINKSGYYLFYGDGTAGSTSLRLELRSETGSGFSFFITGTTLALNAWHAIRMTVRAVTANQDEISVLTGAGAVGSEVWTTVFQQLVNDTDAHYCNWGDATSGRVGYAYEASTIDPNGGDSGQPTAYIDMFEAKRRDP